MKKNIHCNRLFTCEESTVHFICFLVNNPKVKKKTLFKKHEFIQFHFCIIIMYLEKEEATLHKTAKNYLTFSNIFVIHMVHLLTNETQPKMKN